MFACAAEIYLLAVQNVARGREGLELDRVWS
jgi:hypothetical protein